MQGSETSRASISIRRERSLSSAENVSAVSKIDPVGYLCWHFFSETENATDSGRLMVRTSGYVIFFLQNFAAVLS
jgi:hypothetical protein